VPGFENGIGCAFTKKVDENSCCPHNSDISIFKAQGDPRGNPENHYREETLVEITDTSITAENVSFIFDAYWGIFFNFSHLVFYPSADFLLR